MPPPTIEDAFAAQTRAVEALQALARTLYSHLPPTVAKLRATHLRQMAERPMEMDLESEMAEPKASTETRPACTCPGYLPGGIVAMTSPACPHHGTKLCLCNVFTVHPNCPAHPRTPPCTCLRTGPRRMVDPDCKAHGAST